MRDHEARVPLSGDAVDGVIAHALGDAIDGAGGYTIVSSASSSRCGVALNTLSEARSPV